MWKLTLGYGNKRRGKGKDGGYLESQIMILNTIRYVHSSNNITTKSIVSTYVAIPSVEDCVEMVG
jgi:hypothetical protein